MPLAWISLTLSRHFSPSFIASSRSLGLHPVSSHSCWMYVWAGCPAFARLYVGIHRSTSLMSSSLLLKQCPACLVHLTWIVFAMGGRWPYSWCSMGCCCQDLFNTVCNAQTMNFNSGTYAYGFKQGHDAVEAIKTYVVQKMKKVQLIMVLVVRTLMIR